VAMLLVGEGGGRCLSGRGEVWYVAISLDPSKLEEGSWPDLAGYHC
jgi:hypothetical protein